MNRLNLCLHAGGHLATIDEVAAVKVPEPDGIWHPISHMSLYQQVCMALGNLNMHIEHQQFALAKEGNRFFALLQIGNGVAQSEEFAYVCGIRGSLDKSYAAGLAFGSGVFVCDNLAFTGEITIARKYTTYIERDLPRLATNAVARLSEKWVDMNKRFDAYKYSELDERHVNDLTIRAMDCGAITSQQIPYVLNEWRKPERPEFADMPRNVWRYFNSVTSVLKGMNVFALPKRTQNLHALLDSECGLTVAQSDLTADTVDAEVRINN